MLLVVSIAVVSASVGGHHHTHLHAPLQMDLEMDEDRLAEELGSQQKIQVSVSHHLTRTCVSTNVESKLPREVYSRSISNTHPHDRHPSLA